MPKAKINSHFKPHRTKEQIEADHAHLCAQLGNATFTYMALQKDLQRRMEELSAEYKTAKPSVVKDASEVTLNPTGES